MGLEGFIPTIWSARLLTHLHKALVYGQARVANRDYEGEIRAAGDTVRISAIGPVTVFDYVRDVDMPAPQALQDASLLLRIERARGFSFVLDDIDRAQSRADVADEAMREASFALRDAADMYIAGLAAAEAGILIGTDASPRVLNTPELAYNMLVDISIEMDRNNVPRGDRWVVIPPWVHGLFLRDARFVGAGAISAGQALINGEMGQAAGFSIIVSNNVPTDVPGTRFRVLAGTPAALAYAEQIMNVEAFRPERRFEDAVKGLHVYGAKVVRPTGLCRAICSAS